MSATVVEEAALRAAVGLTAEAMAVVGEGFVALSRGRATMPAILRLDVPGRRAEMDVKTAYLDGLPVFAVKMSTGFFDNAALGLPSLGGLMVAFDAATGVVRAVLLDNGYLTDVRTALAGALAARHLARAGARTAAIVGTGTQARLQAEALRLVRPIERFLVWGRDPARARACAADIAARTGAEARAAGLEEAVRLADVVVTTTPSTTPLVRAAWLRPGQHVTAVGADAEHKAEVEPAALALADRLVVDDRGQCARLGELRHAIAGGAVPPDVATVDLGAIIVGDAPGRRSDDELTLCDLTGTGAQDTAIANHVLALLAR